MTTAPNRTETRKTTAAGQDFMSTKTIAAPPQRVMAALRSPEAVTDWWAPTAGSGDIGGTLEVTFLNRRQVIELHVEPSDESKVVWRVVQAPLTPDWDATTIVFDVAATGDGSVLHFRHHGLTPELECFEMCHEGWTHYLGSLVSYVETGEGQPSRHGDG